MSLTWVDSSLLLNFTRTPGWPHAYTTDHHHVKRNQINRRLQQSVFPKRLSEHSVELRAQGGNARCAAVTTSLMETSVIFGRKAGFKRRRVEWTCVGGKCLVSNHSDRDEAEGMLVAAICDHHDRLATTM